MELFSNFRLFKTFKDSAVKVQTPATLVRYKVGMIILPEIELAGEIVLGSDMCK